MIFIKVLFGHMDQKEGRDIIYKLMTMFMEAAIGSDYAQVE